MTDTLRRGLATIVTIGAALALAVVSSAPLRVNALPDARLRVAFSARPQRIETCRTPSADELANLPAHMRQGVVCEGITASYRLEVRRDDSLVASAILRGGGLRHDRQLYALRELRVPSGRSTIDVRLVRVDTVASRPDSEPRALDEHAREEGAERGARDGGAHDDDGRRDARSRDEDEHRRRVADEVPPALTLHEVVILNPREVLLVTYDQGSRRLRTVRAAQ